MSSWSLAFDTCTSYYFQHQAVKNGFVLTDIIDRLYVFGKTESVVILEMWVVLNRGFEMFRVVVDEDGVLLDFIPIDFKKLDFRVLLNDLVEVFGCRLAEILLFHFNYYF